MVLNQSITSDMAALVPPVPNCARLVYPRCARHVIFRGDLYHGVRADLASVDDDIVRVRVSAEGQKNKRPPAAQLRREIEIAVLELTPDATEIVIEGLEDAGGAQEQYIPISAIAGRKHAVA